MKELIYVQQNLSVPKNKKQQNYSYRSVEDILEAVKKIIPEGCFITMADSVQCIGDRNYVCASATFSNGEDSIHSTGYAWEPAKLAAMSSPQITGSCSSYARKSALCGLLLIDDNKDVDSFNLGDTGPYIAATKEQIDKIAKYRDYFMNSSPDKAKYLDKAIKGNLDYHKAEEIIGRLQE